MATKANPGEFDCYGNAADDEPLFVLRANDPYAPNAIRHWAETYKLSKEIDNNTGYGPEPLTERQQAKYAEALACANTMEAYRESATARKE